MILTSAILLLFPFLPRNLFDLEEPGFPGLLTRNIYSSSFNTNIFKHPLKMIFLFVATEDNLKSKKRFLSKFRYFLTKKSLNNSKVS